MENFYKLDRRSRQQDRIWTAWCVELDDKVIIKAGSLISNDVLSNLTKTIKEKRDNAKIDENRRLLQNVEVKNLSQAAMFVLATNATPKYWKKCETFKY